MIRRRGFTLMEMFVVMSIVTMIMGYAYKFYFQGRETMRYTVSQQQVQAETRWFFDQMARDISSAYRFIELSESKHQISFYAFQTGRSTLEDVLYDKNGIPLADIDRFIKVLRIDYIWNPADGSVTREQKPLYLHFLRNPMEARDQPQAEWEGDASATPGKKVVLHSISDFLFQGYEQTFDYAKPKTDNPIVIRKVDGTIPADARKTTFVVIRVHTKIEEKASDRKDEELDLVAKFYSRVRLADAAYPGYFSQTDENGAF